MSPSMTRTELTAITADSDPAHTQLALNTLLHAADIGSSTKQWPLYTKWTAALFEEFWAQGDDEKRVRMTT